MSTTRVALIPLTREAVLARVAAMAPEARAEVSADWLARVHAAPAVDPWVFGFVVVDRPRGCPVGQVGFHAPPADGMVEIAYGIDAAWQGQGDATEAVAAVLAFCFADPRVHVVRAHTRPAASASTRVLTTCGFHLVGDVIAPADGLVWRWEHARPITESHP